jgi:CubicO group peptidase (beta-lactamase class C family)
MRLWACLLIVETSISACGGSAPKERSQPRPAPRAQRPAVFPSQPQGVRFPTRSWPRGEWPSTADRAAVDDAVDVALNDGGDARVRAMPGFSMAKSITSALVGTLVKDDRLDVDARAPVPEWSGQGDPRRGILEAFAGRR